MAAVLARALYADDAEIIDLGSGLDLDLADAVSSDEEEAALEERYAALCGPVTITKKGASA